MLGWREKKRKTCKEKENSVLFGEMAIRWIARKEKQYARAMTLRLSRK
jgi:hypothetical protein